jgi:hypothetical protein
MGLSVCPVYLFSQFGQVNWYTPFLTYEIGPMESIMHIIHVTNKGKMMDTMEKFYIYSETEVKNQINNKLTVQNNAIFETIVYEDPYKGLGSPTINQPG